jgi:catechol 2,3-dioxygenase-like lactoylglutathione lyase family enzyme
MKRMHIHVGVENLDQAVTFYSTLFGTEPAKTKSDYAKWMLEDPRINFAISTRSGKTGVDHLGIQVDGQEELGDIRDRLKNADISTFDEGETECCYARSNKSWVEDPAGVPWEAYETMENIQFFDSKEQPAAQTSSATQNSTENTDDLPRQSGGCC